MIKHEKSHGTQTYSKRFDVYASITSMKKYLYLKNTKIYALHVLTNGRKRLGAAPGVGGKFK